MGFSTMKDSDCLVRKALAQFKWADAESVVNGQTLQTGAKAAVQDAAEAAKKENLAKPTVKVGLVGKHLVFRIKHDGGHWGKDDVVLVKNFVRAGPEGGSVTKAMLKSSKQKDMLTVAWWNDTRGDMDPGNLGRALSAWESFAALKPEQESLATLGSAAATYVVPIERAIADLKGRLGHKDDQALLVRLENAVSQARDLVESRTTAYSTRLAKAKKGADSVVKSRKDNISQSVGKALESVKKQDFEMMYRDYTRVKQTAMREDADGAITQAVKDSAGAEKVDPNELLNAVLQSVAVKEYREALKTLPLVCREIIEDIDELESQRDPDDAHPDRTTSQDPNYRQELQACNHEYTRVFQSIVGAGRVAGQLAGQLKQLAAATTGVSKWDDRVGQSILGAITRLQNLYKTTVQIYSGIRNESGAVKKRVAAAKITTEDKAKFLTPILNRCMARWYDYREAEAACYAYIEHVAATIEQKFGDDVKDVVKSLREASNASRLAKD